MDRHESLGNKPESRSADKSDSRQTEMDARYRESLTWRNSVRGEDVDWRQTTRRQDAEWRELTRKEDKAWRESARGEDLEWRAEVRDEDRQHRLRTERISTRCHALTAAAYASKPGSSVEVILALAQQFEGWLNSKNK